MDFMHDVPEAMSRVLRTFKVVDDLATGKPWLGLTLEWICHCQLFGLSALMRESSTGAASSGFQDATTVPVYHQPRVQKLSPWPEAIELPYIQPGKPTPNAYVERFNRTARHEYLEFRFVRDGQPVLGASDPMAYPVHN